MLSNVGIEKRMDWGELTVESDNYDTDVQPSSIDLHLSDEFVFIKSTDEVVVDDMSTYPSYIFDTMKEVTIEPNEFVLAQTDEYVDMPHDLGGVLHGRSSVGRLGLFVHNAGFVDSGFEGTLTLELYNAAPYPITLKEGMAIVQMSLYGFNTEPSIEYSDSNGNKYDGQCHTTPSQLWADF
jgi:dCTP deaminase